MCLITSPVKSIHDLEPSANITMHNPSLRASRWKSGAENTVPGCSWERRLFQDLAPTPGPFQAELTVNQKSVLLVA